MVTETFNTAVVGTVQDRVPRAKPSPYAKRWWTPDLSLLRRALTSARNHLTTLQRRGEETSEARQMFQDLRRGYFRQIETQKKQHWKDFLADPTNIWKANSYARTMSQAGTVPTLVLDEVTADSDESKASLLMATFFPTPSGAKDDGSRRCDEGLSWQKQGSTGSAPDHGQ